MKLSILGPVLMRKVSVKPNLRDRTWGKQGSVQADRQAGRQSGRQAEAGEEARPTDGINGSHFENELGVLQCAQREGVNTASTV